MATSVSTSPSIPASPRRPRRAKLSLVLTTNALLQGPAQEPAPADARVDPVVAPTPSAGYPRLLAPPYLDGSPVPLPAQTIAAINARYLQLYERPSTLSESLASLTLSELPGSSWLAAARLRQRLPLPSRVPETLLIQLSALCSLNLNPNGLTTALYESLNNPAGLRLIANTVHKGIQQWLTKRQSRCDSIGSVKPSEPASLFTPGGSLIVPSTGSGTSNTPRSRTMKDLAHLRDKNLCVITGNMVNQVAHIFPYSIGSTPEAGHEFRVYLRLFASATIADSVDAYLGLGQNNCRSSINRLENLITLDPVLHESWAKGCVLLEPIGDPLANTIGPLESYSVRLSYLPAHRRHQPPASANASAQEPPLVLPLPTNQYSTKRDDPSLRGMAISQLLFSPEDSQEVVGTRLMQTGDVIVLRTEDPVKLPLPHPDLLTLHAALSRVVRCAGAGQGYEPEWWEEEDDMDEPRVVLDTMIPKMDAKSRVLEYLDSLQTTWEVKESGAHHSDDYKIIIPEAIPSSPESTNASGGHKPRKMQAAKARPAPRGKQLKPGAIGRPRVRKLCM